MHFDHHNEMQSAPDLLRGHHECRHHHDDHEHRCPHHHDRLGHHGHRHMGPQTFRRGRAIDFLERLEVRQSTLRQQLEQPVLQSIRDVINGELKAVEAIIAEFAQLFDLHEPDVSDDEHNDGADRTNQAAPTE